MIWHRLGHNFSHGGRYKQLGHSESKLIFLLFLDTRTSNVLSLHKIFAKSFGRSIIYRKKILLEGSINITYNFCKQKASYKISVKLHSLQVFYRWKIFQQIVYRKQNCYTNCIYPTRQICNSIFDAIEQGGGLTQTAIGRTSPISRADIYPEWLGIVKRKPLLLQKVRKIVEDTKFRRLFQKVSRPGSVRFFYGENIMLLYTE